MRSNYISLMTLISFLLNAIGLIVGVVLIAKYRRLSQMVARFGTAVDADFQSLSTDLDTLSQSSAASNRRLDSLEKNARARAIPEPLQSENPVDTKLNITERRHRVLSLWKRGLSMHGISARLGIPVGEVELMIDLERAA